MSGYYLVKLTPSGEEPLDGYEPFEDGAAAARKAKELSMLPFLRIQPRRMRQAGNPAEIFAKRMASDDTMSALPEGWSVKPIEGHFAHLRSRSTGRICFYDTADHCILNRTTEMRPGTYLRRFYPEMLDLELRQLSAQITPAPEFEIATTEDDIEWVYENGPSSCMTTEWHDNKGKPFDSWCHPVRVYAAGDLAVAYRKSGESVVERCLIWPEKMVRGRIYGDGTGTLQRQLEQAGYQTGDGDRFDGARLLRRIIMHGDGDLAFICPYLDAGLAAEGGSMHAVDDGQFLRISARHVRGAMDADQTNGLADDFLPANGSSRTLYEPAPKAAMQSYRDWRDGSTDMDEAA